MTVAILLSQVSIVALFGILAWKIARLYRRRAREPATSVAVMRQMRENTAKAEAATPARGQASPQAVNARERTTRSSESAQHLAKADRMARAQIFAGIQMLDAKRQGLNFRDGAGETCEKLAAAYLTGAARAITFDMSGGDAEARDVTAFLLTHNLSFKAQAAAQAIDEMTRDDMALASFRAGLEAADSWLARKFVPDEYSLFRAVSDNAFL